MIDAIAEAEGISVSSKQFKAIVGKGNYVYFTDINIDFCYFDLAQHLPQYLCINQNIIKEGVVFLAIGLSKLLRASCELSYKAVKSSVVLTFLMLLSTI